MLLIISVFFEFICYIKTIVSERNREVDFVFYLNKEQKKKETHVEVSFLILGSILFTKSNHQGDGEQHKEQAERRHPIKVFTKE
ncbi:hypothetical protein M2306_000220 [Myroides gitamensis]|nr:hypothetical protein [Myroides gitamensis]